MHRKVRIYLDAPAEPATLTVIQNQVSRMKTHEKIVRAKVDKPQHVRVRAIASTELLVIGGEPGVANLQIWLEEQEEPVTITRTTAKRVQIQRDTIGRLGIEVPSSAGIDHGLRHSKLSF